MGWQWFAKSSVYFLITQCRHVSQLHRWRAPTAGKQYPARSSYMPCAVALHWQSYLSRVWRMQCHPRPYSSIQRFDWSILIRWRRDVSRNKAHSAASREQGPPRPNFKRPAHWPMCAQYRHHRRISYGQVSTNERALSSTTLIIFISIWHPLPNKRRRMEVRTSKIQCKQSSQHSTQALSTGITINHI